MQAWSIVLFAVAIRCLRQLPRPLIVALVLAMAAEFVMVDIQTIRAQSIVLDLPEHPSALQGNPPLGELLPRPAFRGHFTTDYDYYNNYRLKITVGAVYFRDLHPNTFGIVAWLMFAAGAAGFGFVCRGANGRAHKGGEQTSSRTGLSPAAGF